MTLLKEKITFGTIMGVVREYFVMTIGILLYTFAWIACIPVSYTHLTLPTIYSV